MKELENVLGRLIFLFPFIPVLIEAIYSKWEQKHPPDFEKRRKKYETLVFGDTPGNKLKTKLIFAPFIISEIFLIWLWLVLRIDLIWGTVIMSVPLGLYLYYLIASIVRFIKNKKYYIRNPRLSDDIVRVLDQRFARDKAEMAPFKAHSEWQVIERITEKLIIVLALLLILWLLICVKFYRQPASFGEWVTILVPVAVLTMLILLGIVRLKRGREADENAQEEMEQIKKKKAGRHAEKNGI